MSSGVRLAVDVGTVRVGVAACDPGARLAFPVATLARDGSTVTRLAAEARERAAVEVLIGLPRTLAGHDGPAACAAREFAAELAAALDGVPVRLVDERLTTVVAARSLRAAGIGSRAGRAVIDQQAAVELLQGVLDGIPAAGEELR